MCLNLYFNFLYLFILLFFFLEDSYSDYYYYYQVYSFFQSNMNKVIVKVQINKKNNIVKFRITFILL
jgi:hypothetical protein